MQSYRKREFFTKQLLYRMRKICTTVLLLSIALASHAQLSGTGYYRFRNAQETRDYISFANNIFDYVVIVDKASGGFTNLAGDDGKQRALACASKYMQTDIHLVNDANCIDASTVIYAKKRYPNNSSSYEYDLIGQTVSLTELTAGVVSHPNSFLKPSLTFKDLYATIKQSSGSGSEALYTAYIPLTGTLKYLGTTTQSLGNRYFVDTNNIFDIAESNSAQNAKWYIEPVDYFNIQPEVEFAGKHYTTLYVPFEFQLGNNVQKAYAITVVGSDGALELEEIAANGGTVPAGTPVLLECASDQAVDCKVKPMGAPKTDNTSNYSGANILMGTYFCNQDGNLSYPTSSSTGTINANNFTAPTNPQKYVLGITASGKLGFVKATGTAMPANKAWLEYTGTAELVLPFEDTSFTLGDVNRDGLVNIADVTATVDIVLGKDSQEPFAYDHKAADIDGSGTITITDVTALVNIILTNN